MALFSLVMVGVLVILITTSSADQALPQSKPGCSDNCGDVTIPYPFGIGDGCYLRPVFNITCAQSDGQPPIAYLMTGTANVTSISLDGEMHILKGIAHDCYNKEGRRTSWKTPAFSVYPPYSFSSTKNKFVVVGCDTYAYSIGYQGNQKYTSGCMSLCDDLGTAREADSCSGIGCCQTSIPSGLKNQTIQLGTYNYHTRIWDFNPCSYAFLVEEGKFQFNGTSFQTLNSTSLLPAVLNWYIGDETCDTAQKRDDYACKPNSYCQGSSTGYTCRCNQGYQGNPYLPQGCQDINECEPSNPCKNGKCINTEGSHYCTCNSGYRNLDPKTCIRGTNNTALKISLGVSLGVSGLLVMILWIFCVVKRRKAKKMRERFYKENGGLLVQQRLASYNGSVDEAVIFSEQQIKTFTNNYAEKLGEGAFGIVYKGKLPGNNLPEDKKVVAVKISKLNAPVANSAEFGNEVILLSQVKQRNVLMLRGCCLETKTPILVYEYISQGTLYDHIHKVDGKEPLSWPIRLKIATGTAKALAYLHHSLVNPIIHRDVKSMNILLDKNFEAKVSDFGASKLMEEGENRVATAIHGTPGYLDPEYNELGILTKKSDVYSFGVVLVELLTSKSTFVRTNDEREERKLADVFVAVEEKRLNEILDPEISKERHEFPTTVERVADLAKRCLASKGNERPPMNKVAAELRDIFDEVWGKHPDEGGAYVKQSPKDVRDEGEDGDSVMTTTSADCHQSMQNQTQMVKPFESGR